MLNKLSQDFIQPNLHGFMNEKGFSVDCIHHMSVDELRTFWRVVHRRWHSSNRNRVNQMEGRAMTVRRARQRDGAE